jgi:hypothetical protein
MQSDVMRELEARANWEGGQVGSKEDRSSLERDRYDLKEVIDSPGMVVVRKMLEERVRNGKDSLVICDSFSKMRYVQGIISGLSNFWYDVMSFVRDEEE